MAWLIKCTCFGDDDIDPSKDETLDDEKVSLNGTHKAVITDDAINEPLLLVPKLNNLKSYHTLMKIDMSNTVKIVPKNKFDLILYEIHSKSRLAEKYLTEISKILKEMSQSKRDNYTISGTSFIFNYIKMEELIHLLSFDYVKSKNEWICDLTEGNVIANIKNCLSVCNEYIADYYESNEIQRAILHRRTQSMVIPVHELNLTLPNIDEFIAESEFKINENDPKTTASNPKETKITRNVSVSASVSRNTEIRSSETLSTHKGVYLDELIWIICSPKQNINDNNHLIDSILLTHNCFVTNNELLSSLIKRFFNEDNSKLNIDDNYDGLNNVTFLVNSKSNPDNSIIDIDINIQFKVVNILKRWMHMHWMEDFHDNNELINGCNGFIKRIEQACHNIMDDDSTINERLKLAEIIKEYMDMQEKQFQIQNKKKQKTKKKRDIFKIKDIIKDDLFNIENQSIADELTLIDFELFLLIRKRECLNENWKKSKNNLKYKLAPNICNLLKHFNNIDAWVKMTVLTTKNIKRRARTIKKFIKIMYILFKEHRNFQSLFAIYSALNSTSIYRYDIHLYIHALMSHMCIGFILKKS